ncbi:MAG: AAA family ATPase [Erysipelotrichaceae bacterium]|nr:AAA family ATPase [Erysipelotrichaceae bacterium]
MGSFHCPVGGLAYKSFGCIECGLCIASTKEERIKASDIIREYIRNSHDTGTDRRIRKIAVCGKGGSGKSTVAALFSLALEEFGYKVLLIDADNSNTGLGRKVGISEKAVSFMNQVNENNRKAIEIAKKDPIAIDDFDDELSLSKDNIKLLSIGKIENVFEGCACENASMAASLINSLNTDDFEIIIADQDAGIESFGRGVEQGVDTLIIIVEPSYDSIELAKNIKYMGEGLGIRRIRAVLSKIHNEEEEEYIEDILSDNEIRFLGALYEDPSLNVLNLKGEPLKTADSYKQAKHLVDLMLDEAEMKKTKGE